MTISFSFRLKKIFEVYVADIVDMLIFIYLFIFIFYYFRFNILNWVFCIFTEKPHRYNLYCIMYFLLSVGIISANCSIV